MVHDTPSFEDAFTHQIWNSYLTVYRRYAPDSMQFLETKMHPHAIFGIPTFKLYKRNVPDTIIQKVSQRSGNSTRKWYTTLRHPEMHPHTKFGIHISNSIRYMLGTQQILKLGQGHSNQKMVCDTPPSQDAFTHQI